MKYTGTVKWFSKEKGFGFITCNELKKDLFVHFENIVGDGFRSLVMGESVKFKTQEVPKGTMAIEVERNQEKA